MMICIIIGCSELNKKVGLEDDHLVEELAEEALRQKTGIDLDFSPFSPEIDTGLYYFPVEK